MHVVLTSLPLGDILLQFGAMWELWGASSSFVSSSSWLWSLHINGTRTGMCFCGKLSLTELKLPTTDKGCALDYTPCGPFHFLLFDTVFCPALPYVPGCVGPVWLAGHVYPVWLAGRVEYVWLASCVNPVWLAGHVDHVWLTGYMDRVCLAGCVDPVWLTWLWAKYVCTLDMHCLVSTPTRLKSKASTNGTMLWSRRSSVKSLGWNSSLLGKRKRLVSMF